MSAAEPASETPKDEFDASVQREGAQEEAEPSTVETSERSTGSVKWFSVTKGKTRACQNIIKVRHWAGQKDTRSPEAPQTST